VVELQNDWVGLAAVDARVIEQVLEQPAIQGVGSCSDVATVALDVERFVLAVMRPSVDGK
jgi:hypothetical protein